MLQRRTCGLELVCFISCALFGGDAQKADAPAPRKLSVAVSNLPNETPPSKDAVIFMTQFHQIMARDFSRQFTLPETKVILQDQFRHGFLKTERRTEQFQVIGMLGKEPIAYENYEVNLLPDGKPWDGAIKEKRALRDFERRAIAELKKGRDIVIEMENPRNPAKDLPEEAIKNSVKVLFAVGAMYAEKSCLQCHAVKENQMIGAISYRVSTGFIEWSVPRMKEAWNKEAARLLGPAAEKEGK